MAQTTAPFVLKDVSVTLVKQGDATAPIEFRCQLSQAQLTPAAGTGSSGSQLETFCATYDSSGSSASVFNLDLSGFQAWSDINDFSVISYQEEGNKFDFVLMPLAGPVSNTSPSFSGTVTMVATAVGGTANTYATFTASLPCVEKPLMSTVAAF